MQAKSIKSYDARIHNVTRFCSVPRELPKLCTPTCHFELNPLLLGSIGSEGFIFLFCYLKINFIVTVAPSSLHPISQYFQLYFVHFASVSVLIHLFTCSTSIVKYKLNKMFCPAFANSIGIAIVQCARYTFSDSAITFDNEKMSWHKQP